MKGSDNQEKLVYQIIEDAGDKGLCLVYRVSCFTVSLWSAIAILFLNMVEFQKYEKIIDCLLSKYKKKSGQIHFPTYVIKD